MCLLTDVLSKRQRSYNMSRIKGKNTAPELIIRSSLWAAGIKGYRVHQRIPGRPDIVFRADRLAVFIDGCFWHKCPRDYRTPETRKAFWAKKIGQNVQRDRRVDEELQVDGWRVLRVWEHEVRASPQGVVGLIARERTNKRSQTVRIS